MKWMWLLSAGLFAFSSSIWLCLLATHGGWMNLVALLVNLLAMVSTARRYISERRVLRDLDEKSRAAWASMGVVENRD